MIENLHDNLICDQGQNSILYVEEGYKFWITQKLLLLQLDTGISSKDPELIYLRGHLR